MTVAQRQGQSCKYDIMLDEEHFDIDEFVAEANKWDDLYLHSTIHAVELYHRQSQVREIILKFVSRKNRAAFKLTNPFSKRIWLRELLSAFLSDPKRPETQHEKEYGRVGMMTGLKRGHVACALVTFTDETWACPDTAIEFDLGRAKQKVRNALNGLSFVAAFEAAHYVNENWEKNGKRGKLVSFHCHAVVWATHKSQLARRRSRIKPRFRAILGNKTGVRFDVLKKADDLCKAIRYQAKMPARGYRTVAQAGARKPKPRPTSPTWHGIGCSRPLHNTTCSIFGLPVGRENGFSARLERTWPNIVSANESKSLLEQ